MSVRVEHGDCREVIKGMAEASVDSVVTDPPYSLVSIQKRFGKPGSAPAKEGKDGLYRRASAGFMGKQWDTGETAFDPAWWGEVYRVLKPGAHLVAFGGTRTYHRMACAIEDAGFEIRDQLAWAYGSGFPKSHNIGKAIDKIRDWSLVERLSEEIKRARAAAGLSLAEIGEKMLAETGEQYGRWYHRGGHMFFETGRSLPSRPEWDYLRNVLPIADAFRSVYEEAEREVVSRQRYGRSDKGAWAANIAGGMFRPGERDHDITAPATDAAAQWEGWGTALKPAWEPIVLARKPLGSSAINVVSIVERQLNERGVTGPILWKQEHASDAAKRKTRSSSDPTKAPQSQEGGSAENAITPGLPKSEARIENASESARGNGMPEIPVERDNRVGRQTESFEPRSSQRMGRSAPVAENESSSSSPLTTSMAEEPSTGRPSTERSTRSSVAMGSRADIECFAGIATGLSGSTAFVLIIRDSEDGAFIWPEGLPKYVPAHPLTVAGNVLQHGVGAINIDGCRIGDDLRLYLSASSNEIYGQFKGTETAGRVVAGRWPANLCTDGSEEVLACFPESDGQQRDVRGDEASTRNVYGTYSSAPAHVARNDTGSAARFFFSAKADADDRIGSKHPTVKPVALMRWLVRLITPPGGLVLDPFAGTGTTGVACLREGMRAVLIEREDEYVADIRRRLAMLSGLDMPLLAGGAP